MGKSMPHRCGRVSDRGSALRAARRSHSSLPPRPHSPLWYTIALGQAPGLLPQQTRVRVYVPVLGSRGGERNHDAAEWRPTHDSVPLSWAAKPGICVANPDLSGEKLVFEGGVAYPSFSPDGGRVSMEADKIYIINAGGSELRKVVDAPVLPLWFWEKIAWRP